MITVNGEPVELPAQCEAVFAIIDTATKTGRENDGTGVIYFAVVRNLIRLVGVAVHPLHDLRKLGVLRGPSFKDRR